MTTTNHTDISSARALANAATFNAPFGQLDAAIGDRSMLSTPGADLVTALGGINTSLLAETVARLLVTAEVTTARSVYATLADRLNSFVLAGGNVATTTTASKAAGLTALTVASITGFIAGARIFIPYTAGGGEYNVINGAPSGSTITLTTALGGAVSSGVVISMISESEYQAAQALPHSGVLTLAQALTLAAGGVSNVLSYGTTSTALQAAIDALPPYAAGNGGGVVLVSGIITMTGPVTLPSGVTLRGTGRRTTLLTGTVAGPLIQTASDGTGTTLTAYARIQDLMVRNLSNNAAARAITLTQTANLRLERVVAYTLGGHHVEVVGGQTLTLDGCTLAGSAGAESCLYLNGTSANGLVNVVRVLNSDFQDAKSGIRAISGSALKISGCHFEQLAGGATGFDASVFVDGWLGGEITGSYWDTCSQTFLTFNNLQRNPTGFIIGGNYFYNSSNNNPVIVSTLYYSTVFPNYFKSGAINANSNGLYVDGTATFNVIHPQFRFAGGTGVALNLQGTSIGNRVFKPASGTATWDPASIANGAQVTTTVTVTGASLGDKVNVTFGISLGGLQLSAYVSTTNTVTVVLSNTTGGAVDLGSGTLYVTVERL